MRILLVSGTFPPMKCGVGNYTADLSVSLAKRAGVEVGVLTSAGADESAAPGVRVLPAARGWGMADVPRIVSVLRSWRPDIVNFQFPTNVYGRSQWVLPWIARLVNGPVAQTWHEYHLEGNIPNLPNALLPGGLIVVRPHFLDRMPSWYRACLAFKKVAFIPNASTLPDVALSREDRDGILDRWGLSGGRTVAYFGFASPAKGVDLLFEILDPAQHRLALICDLDPSDGYQKALLERADAPPWKGRVAVTGFLPAEEAARLLAASDAAVFPFLEGGGEWNTSLRGAMAQGTFVLTTSDERNGYQPGENVYYAQPRNVDEMREALSRHIGARGAGRKPSLEWEAIAERHVRFYESLVS